MCSRKNLSKVQWASYAVQFLLFATAIELVIVSGEIKNQTKFLLYIPPVSEADQKVNVCHVWKVPREILNPEVTPDINLNIYPSRDGSHEFILCAYPKTGCSQWIMLLHYLLSGEKITAYMHGQGARQRTEVTTNTTSLTNVSVPRILIMRDPYKRTISSYHDFRRRNPEMTNISFPTFIFEYVNKTSTKSKQGKDHRMPISHGCSNPIWIHGGWDYVFQLEQMSLWLPCMLDMLNLAHIVNDGWNNSSLFHAPEFNLSEAIHTAVLGSRKEKVKSIETGHENPEDDLHTPDTISVVNRVFFNDFVLGGYRLRST